MCINKCDRSSSNPPGAAPGPGLQTWLHTKSASCNKLPGYYNSNTCSIAQLQSENIPGILDN